MEPRRRRRGNDKASQFLKAFATQLQWSHGVAAVETTFAISAAILTYQPLQWSHGVAAVETALAGRRAGEGGRASMEPRRRRRGNRRPACRPDPRCWPLQWSHGVAAVETASDGRRSAGVRLASMEPRRRRRENVGQGDGREAQERRFNGATASPPWKPGRLAVEPHAGAHASMEPRRRRRGNQNSRRGTTSLLSLQWSHGVAAVETRAATAGEGGQSPGFNGATASPPWKRAGRVQGPDVRDAASMCR